MYLKFTRTLETIKKYLSATTPTPSTLSGCGQLARLPQLHVMQVALCSKYSCGVCSISLKLDYKYMYVVYSPAGIVQRSQSIFVLYVYVINSLNEILDDIKVSTTGIRNQYSPHSVHISKLLM